MAILDDLDAFLLEHRRCGELRSGFEEGEESSEIVWMDCTCGGHIAKPVAPTQDDPE